MRLSRERKGGTEGGRERRKRKEERKGICEDDRERLRWGRERGDWVGQQTPRGKLSNYAGSARFVAIGRPHGNATFSKSVYTQVNMYAHRRTRSMEGSNAENSSDRYELISNNSDRVNV